MPYFDSQTKNGKSNWINISDKGLETCDQNKSFNNFSFRLVFKKFIKFENFSRFFFTEKIRQRSIIFFTELNSKLLILKERKGKTIKKKSVDAIINQTWDAMTAFLAYVHAINAIIVPVEGMAPLSQDQLITKQEEAFEFFYELHSDIEKFCFKKRTRRSTRACSTIRTENLSFEQIKDHSMNQLFNTLVYSHHVAWIYIELWLTRYRPELQEINCMFYQEQHLVKRSKFMGFLNKICFIFFSGMVKHEELEQAKSRGN
ncbi:hypothetical protein BY996DRAFT_15554 [Phakopsora pachyrhizi]|nr:hypothetical protein BY996DRAFT_15554 [Phakopsora pachyrhizi]